MISKEERNKSISRLKSIDENTEEYDGNLFKADFEIVLQYIEELETKLTDILPKPIFDQQVVNNGEFR